MDPYVPESMDPFSYNASFTDLLNSQQSENFIPQSIPPSNSQAHDDVVVEARKERRKWTPKQDIVLCSSWLNTSKDAVIGNEQKHDAFWNRVASFYNASSNLKGHEDRDSVHCKNRWQRINDAVSKFVGCYEAASRVPISGQNEADVMKTAFDLYFEDYKVKFTLQHAWLELRFDQKWKSSLASKEDASSKRRKLDQTTATSNTEEVRPKGVKATKAMRAKEKKAECNATSVESESSVKVFEHMANIKKQDMEAKERVCKWAVLKQLMASKEPLTDIEITLKTKLINEMIG